jgi:MoaA/NifB/PqqE/SkfB family radical SAM enzyme
MIKITPDKKNKENPLRPFWNNTNQTLKILYRFKSHGTLFFIALRKRASLKRLLITRYAFFFKDSLYPPSMHIEFTNACNLKCVYCNNPHFEYPREMMKESTFENLIKELKKSKVDRVCIGGGEATLHPKFLEFVPKLAEVTKILTIVTNGHWKSEEIPKCLIKSGVNFIEISVECGTREDFEAMRVGSNYDKIISNLIKINELKKQFNSNSHINLRLMVRPSQKGKIESESIKFWQQYCDSIMPQYVMKSQGFETISDVFMPEQMAKDEIPKCTLPFRNIQIRTNGDIPICQVSGSALEKERKVIVGNINTHSLNKVWQEGLFQSYRKAHRERNLEMLEICKGCKGS